MACFSTLILVGIVRAPTDHVETESYGLSCFLYPAFDLCCERKEVSVTISTLAEYEADLSHINIIPKTNNKCGLTRISVEYGQS